MNSRLTALLGLLSLAAAALAANPEPPAAPFNPKIAAASDEAEKAMKQFRLPAGIQASVWAAEPLLAHPVAFCFDDQGACYVAETFRLGRGVTDNRGHMNWLDDELACRTVEDRVALYKKYAKERFASEYESAHDRVKRLVDSKGTGKADQATVFADGFHTAAEGLGAGVLAYNGSVYYTCIPNLWRLKATKGTGTADEREALHTGYGVHVAFIGHDLHGLRMGPDGRIYFSTGDRGLNVTTKDGRKVVLPDCGAVLRCEPDGSNLELVHAGLRNPQELAFDDFGNLFTGDNNSDSGDAARLVYVVEGGDSGWRMYYQYPTKMSDRGPFNAEKIWHLRHEGQPAYIVPPLAHVGSGPAGFTHYPGTGGLPEKYADHFFLCDFHGEPGGSGVWSFAVKPKGAAFERVDNEQFLWGSLATDCEFGPDGGFYVSDWVQGWGLTGKGRIYRFGEPARLQSAAVQEVKKLLAEGFNQRPAEELAKLLGHADQRVRQGAQFALAARGQDGVKPLEDVAKGGANRLARLHAIWGLGQIGRRALAALQPLTSLVTDKDAEVRAQAVKVLGEARWMNGPPFVAFLKDPEPRVRFFAAQALARKGTAAEVPALLELLRANADQDAYLRHAVVNALAGIKDVDALVKAAADDSPSVRLGVLLALRRLERPEIARFLGDADPRLVAEAGRAIYDVPIPEAMPQLAALVTRTGLPETLLHRALAAQFRLGGAAQVAAVAARADVPEKLRVEALQMLGEWARPAGRDRILGAWRPIGERPGEPAAAALRAALAGVFQGSDKVRQEAARVAAQLGIKEIGPTLLALVKDAKNSAAARAEALLALDALKDAGTEEAMRQALADGDPRLRTAGRRILARRQPGEAIPILREALEKGMVADQQGALAILATLPGSQADEVLGQRLDALIAGQLPREVHLDVLEAAAKRGAPEVKQRVAKFEAARPRGDDLAGFRECLAGGDAEKGRKLFFEKAELSCVRCHKVQGTGGDVGPDLSKIAAEKQRDYLLESVVLPNKQIAKGFETVVLALSSGQTVAGIVKAEDAKTIKLITPEAKLLTIAKDEIEERKTGKSAMPEDLLKYLNKSELRDLVEFLAGLK